MKKACLFLLMMMLTIASSAQNVDFNDSYELELKEIVEIPGQSKDALFLSVQTMLSDWTYNSNSQNKVDYSDKEQGVVIFKGRLFLGYKKVGLLFGWNVYADYSMTIRCKDGKYQITLKVPTLFYKFDNPQSSDTTTAPISEVYPEYKHKSGFSIKGASKQYAPTVPDMMKAFNISVKHKIASTDVDDF